MTHEYSFQSQWSRILTAVSASHFYSHPAPCAKYRQKNQNQNAQPCHSQNKNRGSFAKW